MKLKFLKILLWAHLSLQEKMVPSGDFAFGFQLVGIGDFLLAIWFNKIPEKTVVWSANRDNLVQSRSRVQLTTDGDFMLSHPKGEQIW